MQDGDVVRLDGPEYLMGPPGELGDALDGKDRLASMARRACLVPAPVPDLEDPFPARQLQQLAGRACTKGCEIVCPLPIGNAASS